MMTKVALPSQVHFQGYKGPYFLGRDFRRPTAHTSLGPSSTHQGQTQVPWAGGPSLSLAPPIWNYTLVWLGGRLHLSQLCITCSSISHSSNKSRSMGMLFSHVQIIYKYVLKESLALIEVESIAVEVTSYSLLCLVCCWWAGPSWRTGCHPPPCSWTSCASCSSPPPSCSGASRTWPKSLSSDTSR